jgi:aminopeptidase Y
MPSRYSSFSTLLLLCFASAVCARAFGGLPGGQAPILLQEPLRADALVVKDLVNSTILQSAITEENLLKRAHDLYEIAKLSTGEWGHPTRIIGSEGE